jgi:hypothetical protein
MTEWDGNDLALLAPDVDQDRSRALFDRRRARRRTRRRAGIAVLTLTVLAIAGIGGYVWIERSGTVAVETGVAYQPSTDDADLPAFEVLEVRVGAEWTGTLRAAVDRAGLDTLWSESGFDDQPPDVDFRRWVLVAIPISDDACPPALAGFDRTGATLTPTFVEPNEGLCVQPLIPKTFIVTINRSTVIPSFTLRLPRDRSLAPAEQLLDVNVSGGSSPATTDLELRPCVYHDEARVCLDNPGSGGVVALRAIGLQLGSNLMVQTESDESVYTIQDEAEQIVAFYGAPPTGTKLSVIVRGRTATGKLIAGPLRTG